MIAYPLGIAPLPACIFRWIYRAFAIGLSSGLWMSAAVLGQAASTTDHQPNSVVSVPRLQREHDEKIEEIRSEREETKPLLEFRSLMEARKAACSKLALRAGVNETIAKGKKLLEEMASLPGKDKVKLNDNRISDLQKMYVSLPSKVSRAIDGGSLILPVRSANPTISRVIDTVGPSQTKDEPLAQGALERLLTRLGVELDSDAPADAPKVTGAETWESVKKEIQDARNDLVTIESQLPKAVQTFKTGMEEYYANLLKGLDAELAARNAKIKSLQAERDKMEDQLDKAKETQADINTLLVYAVYGMVLAIVGLFFLLRLFPPDLARSIVVERTMIELLSMGFLLLTVIILGTGKLIGAETLGALLGTIAGYIFGQKQGERRGATEERAKMVDLLRGTSDAQPQVIPPAKDDGGKP